VNARDALDKAIAVSRHLVELDESDPYHKLSLAISERKLGELADDRLEFREAVATLGRSLPMFEELVRVHPLVRLFRRELARCHSDLAVALLAVAREGGYFDDPANVVSLRNDVRFTGLHGYEPYEEFLRQLNE
jgi:hypothetical protein